MQVESIFPLLIRHSVKKTKLVDGFEFSSK